MSLVLGNLQLPVAVALAPMASVTNAAYRQLCREQAESGTTTRPAGLFTCEMITATALAFKAPKTLERMVADPGDPIFSVQLYATDPTMVARAVAVACGERGVNHIDLNFGCPVPKVTRRGGGGVLPWKSNLFERIVDQAVKAAGPYGVPVTIKTRIGIDQQHQTMLDAGRIAEQCGVAAVCLHARTVEQAYSGQADWAAIRALVDALTIPVIGNGDIWEADDALRMMKQTGCAGVSVGRGALGRQWLFRDLAARLTGQAMAPYLPTLAEVAGMIHRHATLLINMFGDQAHAMADLRKHMSWYLKGFRVGGDLRGRLALISSLVELDDLLAQLDGDESYPSAALAAPRGRQGAARSHVKMPERWLESRTYTGPALADDGDVSGG
ncbi:MAG: tRNA dihydrouridine synthase DusB [Propionibacteriaceae bacterium]|jgi:nifR3 family TIM-barrel protein|nr:tRNA dihydrouridine synthase DusB [Propionibacteriaceae bacterium]